MKYPIPKRFNEEETFLIFFSKKSLIYTIIGASIGFLPMLIFWKFLDRPITAFFVWVLIALPFFILGQFKFPPDRLYNGGEPLDRIVFRAIRRKLEGKHYYVTMTGRRGKR